MIETTLTYFDIVVISVIGISAMLSLFRGFIRELLSFGTWLGAAILTLYFFPRMAILLEPHIKDETVRSGFAVILCFVLALIILSIITRVITRYVKTGADVGFIDNFLGLIFGVARGVLVVAIGYIAMGVAVDQDNPPEWLSRSETRPYVADAATWLTQFAPEYFEKLSVTGTDLKEKGKEAAEEDNEPSTRWQSMEELQERMGLE